MTERTYLYPALVLDGDGPQVSEEILGEANQAAHDYIRGVNGGAFHNELCLDVLNHRWAGEDLDEADFLSYKITPAQTLRHYHRAMLRANDVIEKHTGKRPALHFMKMQGNDSKRYITYWEWW